MKLLIKTAPYMQYLMEPAAYIKRLKELLQKVSTRLDVDAVLLSGGLDSSVTTYILKDRDPICLTITFEDYGKDVQYATILTKQLKLRHIIINVNTRYAIDKIPIVIKILRTFSPMEIPNDIPLVIAFEYLKSIGCKNVATGDGGDELFCGYSYMLRMDTKELEEYLNKLPKFWYFPSIEIGKHYNIKVVSIFLQEEIVDFALKIPVIYKVHTSPDGRKIGKYILRLAFEKELPHCIVWRSKDPIEVGSGFTKLREYINGLISDSEFEEERKRIYEEDKVIITNKEQLFYYKIFRKFFDKPCNYSRSNLRCPYCGSDLNPYNTKYCYMCGSYISSSGGYIK